MHDSSSGLDVYSSSTERLVGSGLRAKYRNELSTSTLDLRI